MISPAHLTAKILCHEVCDLKIPWDETVSLPIKQKGDEWKLNISNKIEIVESIPSK